MNIEILEYKNYGKTAFITHGNIKLGITTELGPRVIYMSYNGGENLFFEDINRETMRNDPPMSDVFGKDAVWYLYGGHRIWMSPEAYPETYLNDNFPLKYEQNGNSVTFSQQTLPNSKIMTELKLVFENDGAVSVYNTVKNVSSETVNGSVWALSVMAQGGVGFVKLSDENTGLLPNRRIVLWPYTKLSDKRLTLTDKFIAVRQDKTAGCDFKIACESKEGTVYYLNKNVLFKKTFAYDENAQYPDWGVNCEFFTGNNFFELESLSALQDIPAGSSITHKEIWALSECDSLTEISDDLLEKIIKNH
ncbi:MAG: hypothetical protein IKT65_01915 [Clostridia bacterium]|nr:hypothetical protein [Clostridia bacterium]